MQCHDGIDSEAARWIHRLVVRCTVPRYELHLPNPPVATAVNETAACSYIPEFHFHSYHNFNYPLFLIAGCLIVASGLWFFIDPTKEVKSSEF